MSGLSYTSPALLIVCQGLSLNLELAYLARWGATHAPRIFLHLLPQALGLQACATQLFNVGAKDSNSGLHACASKHVTD